MIQNAKEAINNIQSVLEYSLQECDTPDLASKLATEGYISTAGKITVDGILLLGKLQAIAGGSAN
jgi:hypothetical protein